MKTFKKTISLFMALTALIFSNTGLAWHSEKELADLIAREYSIMLSKKQWQQEVQKKDLIEFINTMVPKLYASHDKKYEEETTITITTINNHIEQRKIKTITVPGNDLSTKEVWFLEGYIAQAIWDFLLKCFPGLSLV